MQNLGTRLVPGPRSSASGKRKTPDFRGFPIAGARFVPRGDARVVEEYPLAARAQVVNANAPLAPALSEADTADVENFLREMLLIFPILEVSAFHLSTSARPPETRSTQGATQSILHLTGPQTTATATDSPEGFIVQAGSRGRTKEVPSMHEWLRNIRQSLIGQGILADDGGHLVLTQDYTFDSPSSAAAVLLGRAANGRTEWKDGDGKTLKELQTEALESPAAPSESSSGEESRV
jgi:hypothetical protein